MVSIRKATLDDIGLVDRFQQRLADFERQFDDAIKEEARHLKLSKLIRKLSSDESVVFIAEIEGEPVGMAMAEEEEEGGDWSIHERKGNIGLFYVKEGHRGRGVGSELIKQVLRWFEERGLERVQVIGYHSNNNAKEFYREFGFREMHFFMVKKE